MGIFSGCSSLISLDLSNFNTNKVNNMMMMFSSCSSLNSLNLSNFNTNNVNKMKNIFFNLNNNCKVITLDKTLLKELKN